MSELGPVEEVMTGDPLTLEADELLVVGRARMVACRMRHLPVTSFGRLCGIVSLRDLAGASPGQRAREVMHAPVETLAPEDSIALAAARLLDRRFSSLPVVHRGEIVGIVTCTDLVRFACEKLRDQPITDLMTPLPLFTAYHDLPVRSARARMRHAHIRHLPVEKDHQLIGFVSDVDLLPLDENQTVGEALPDRFIAIAASARAAEAGRLMVRERLEAAPVVGAGLVGVVSAFDFLRHLLR